MRQCTLSRDAVRSLYAEVGEDDRVDRPTHSPRKSRSRRAGTGQADPAAARGDRKSWQLCRQVGHALDGALADCADPVLQGLRVERVEPFPDASRLMVAVAFIDDRPDRIAEVERVMHHLERAGGHLRYAVATAVTRKRAPLLHYRLAEPQPG